MKAATPDDKLARARSVAYLVAGRTGSSFFNPADATAMEALDAAIAIVEGPDPRIVALMRQDRDSFINERDGQLLLGAAPLRTLIERGVLKPPVRLDGWHRLHVLGDVLDARAKLDAHREAEARPDRLEHVTKGGQVRGAAIKAKAAKTKAKRA